jgi:hypothetical protein
VQPRFGGHNLRVFLKRRAAAQRPGPARKAVAEGHTGSSKKRRRCMTNTYIGFLAGNFFEVSGQMFSGSPGEG